MLGSNVPKYSVQLSPSLTSKEKNDNSTLSHGGVLQSSTRTGTFLVAVTVLPPSYNLLQYW